MEMIHMATLIHDDVIDNAATRRGRETASVLFGNTGAILTGDVLLSRAMVILAKDGDLNIIRAVSQAVVEMAEGEVREVELRGLFDVAEDDHLDVLRMKTASFIECCCEVGALLAGASDAARCALKSYGYHVGMAFQIFDDLLDYRGDKAHTGKPQAADFREGCATLPLIYLSPMLTDAEKAMATRKFGNGVTDDEITLLVEWMATRGAFSKAEATAGSHVKEALDALEALPDGPARELLATVGQFVVARQT
jgi:geranylgeranyl pyrophosphate synthase